MHRYYLAAVVLTSIVMTVIIIGFSLGGSPAAARDEQFDRQRSADFASLNNQIVRHWTEESVLPETLNELINVNDLDDPQTKQPYEYKKISNISFELCTTFFTDQSQGVKNTPQKNTAEHHGKGYQCIQYDIPTYAINQKARTATTMPTATPSAQAAVSGTFEKVETKNSETIVTITTDYKTTVAYSTSPQVVLKGKAGLRIFYSDFQQGDKVKLTTTMMPALIIEMQNLSR